MSKKTGKKSALKHGAFSGEVLLWGETQEEYDALKAALYGEWNPEGPTEENLVQTLLDLLWRVKRYTRHQQIRDREKLDDIREQNMLSPIARAMRAHVPAFEKLTTKEQVEDFASKLPEDHGAIIRYKWPLGENDDPSKWGQKIAKGLASFSYPLREGPNEFVAMTDPADLLLSLKIREVIDAKVEQTTKRLVQLKAAKQIHRQLEPKVINGETSQRRPQIEMVRTP